LKKKNSSFSDNNWLILCFAIFFTQIFNTLFKEKLLPIYSDIDIIEEYLSTRKTTYFNILYKRYGRKVYAKCIYLLKDEDSANDAVQDIFIKILLNLENFERKAQFSTWVYSITYNYCIDYLRKKKKEQMLFADENEQTKEIAQDESPDALLLEIDVERLSYILDEMNTEDKTILLMKYQDDMMIKEIAVILNKTESAIKMKLKRAKERALQIYKSHYKD
jgi:RNA polymerase sigma factor (sigma-70 family)